ncbi:hypothetical protein QQ045_011592 [Rhodiola kirilowii]
MLWRCTTQTSSAHINRLVTFDHIAHQSTSALSQLCHDDGFVYCRKRRRRSSDEPFASVTAQTDPKQDLSQLRRNNLHKLKDSIWFNPRREVFLKAFTCVDLVGRDSTILQIVFAFAVDEIWLEFKSSTGGSLVLLGALKDISDFESGDELKEFQHIMDFL